MMAIETVLGKQTKIHLVSQSYGAVRVPLNQNFDYTPRITSKSIFEFDRLDAALNITNFEGSDVRFEYLDSSSKLVDSSINNLSPIASITVDDPASYAEFQIFLNVKNSAGAIFQSVLAYGVRVKGSATTENVTDESRITREGDALNALRVKSGAIEYTRAKTVASTAYDQALANGNSHIDTDTTESMGSSTYALANPPELIPPLSTKRYLLALINGTDNTLLDAPYTIGFSGTGNKTVTITPQLTNTDVFELFSVYIPV
jgi:hypothetical protein